MNVITQYDIGDRVYLSTDPEQYERIVTAISVREGGYTSYELSCGQSISWHNSVEMSKEIDVLMKQNNE